MRSDEESMATIVEGTIGSQNGVAGVMFVIRRAYQNQIHTCTRSQRVFGCGSRYARHGTRATGMLQNWNEDDAMPSIRGHEE